MSCIHDLDENWKCRKCGLDLAPPEAYEDLYKPCINSFSCIKFITYAQKDAEKINAMGGIFGVIMAMRLSREWAKETLACYHCSMRKFSSKIMVPIGGKMHVKEKPKINTMDTEYCSLVATKEYLSAIGRIKW